MKGMYIPLKPSIDTPLTEEEQQCLTWQVLTGCSPASAFKTFVKPELMSMVTASTLAKQLFSSKPALEYIEAYKSTLEKALTPKVVKNVKTFAPTKSEEERKKNKKEAVQTLTDYIINEAMGFENAENKDEILKFADKIGLLDSEEEHIEAPRRYLPETCSSCEYRKWIEENCTIE